MVKRYKPVTVFSASREVTLGSGYEPKADGGKPGKKEGNGGGAGTVPALKQHERKITGLYEGNPLLFKQFQTTKYSERHHENIRDSSNKAPAAGGRQRRGESRHGAEKNRTAVRRGGRRQALRSPGSAAYRAAGRDAGEASSVHKREGPVRDLPGKLPPGCREDALG